MRNSKKGSSAIILLVIVTIVLLSVISWMYLEKLTPENDVKQKVGQNDDVTTEPSSVPSITIISPNGGESLRQNNTYDITWKYAGLNDSDSIIIGFRAPDENICWAGKTAVSNQSYSFIPSQVKCGGSVSALKNGGQFKAQLIVERYADGLGVSDMSDNYFNIAR